ncbi:putative serine protease K12H4.7 [Scaptodrosophila lebanonensis]|uniref:Serine protease K12H4.7 n=1 Tax=Drosophila lebanonensis TaxID=7225 RepID=A0A6J2TID0_DROLE|nr:putative serine protease K12H4.7 [Scaptodrosophila lebanonensis]
MLKYIFLISIILIPSAKAQQVNPSLDNAGIKILWFDQKLDHFNDGDKRTWQMRYMVNEKYFKPNKTIYLFLGGESTILSPNTNASNIMLTNSLMHDAAQKNAGYLIHTEHRFYGESKPTAELSLDDLKFLSSRQALADVAALIRSLKSDISRFGNSKLFVVGGSYSGILVPWFAKLYPDLIDRGWASSAPFQFHLEYERYNIIVARTLEQIGGQECYRRLQNGTEKLANYLNDKDQIEEAMRLLNICNKFNVNNDFALWNVYHKMALVFGTLVQFNTGTNIQAVCKEILQGSNDVEAVSQYIVKQLKDKSQKCIDYSFKTRVENHKILKYTTDSERLWTYQRCKEFGNFPTSEKRYKDMTNKIPLKYFIRTCYMVFGEQFTRERIKENVQRTNAIFKHLHDENRPKGNIFFTRASLDPWVEVGLQNNSMAVLLKDASHCEDLRPIGPHDSKQMRAFKESILAAAAVL